MISKNKNTTENRALRIEALKSLSRAKLDEFAEKTGLEMPENDESFWLTVHFSRYNLPGFTATEREQSRRWIVSRGYSIELLNDALRNGKQIEPKNVPSARDCARCAHGSIAHKDLHCRGCNDGCEFEPVLKDRSNEPKLSPLSPGELLQQKGILPSSSLAVSHSPEGEPVLTLGERIDEGNSDRGEYEGENLDALTYQFEAFKRGSALIFREIELAQELERLSDREIVEICFGTIYPILRDGTKERIAFEVLLNRFCTRASIEFAGFGEPEPVVCLIHARENCGRCKWVYEQPIDESWLHRRHHFREVPRTIARSTKCRSNLAAFGLEMFSKRSLMIKGSPRAMK